MRRRQWHTTPVLLPGKSHGPRSLVGCSPWGHEESDTTEQFHFHFSLSRIGEDGNPLQCSCLENPRDGGAWWAAICGVTQSRTRLKRLSSSSSKCPVSHLTLHTENEKSHVILSKSLRRFSAQRLRGNLACSWHTEPGTLTPAAPLEPPSHSPPMSSL